MSEPNSKVLDKEGLSYFWGKIKSLVNTSISDIPDASSSNRGLMTSGMYNKLDGIEEGANKTIVDSAMSDTSENPVQNKVIKAAFSNIEADYIKAEQADLKYATIDLANVEAGSVKTAMIDTGAVQTAQIADGSITDAKIVGLTANKITAGTLDAGSIDVINLNADNLRVGTINGQRIADGAIDMSKLSQNVSDTINSAEADTQILFALSSSASAAPTSGWSETAPDWVDGMYMWQKQVITYVDGDVLEKAPVCLSGATGQSGEDATVLRIDSSKGTVFKNNDFSTVMTVVIWKGAREITTIAALHEVYGNSAYLEWKWRRYDDDDFHVISVDDSRITQNGFMFTVTPDDVDDKIVFQCDLQI